jgi:hypothetical protein
MKLSPRRLARRCTVMSQVPHSTLEVAPNLDLPEPAKYAYYAPEVWHNPDDDTNKFTYVAEAHEKQSQPPRTCGLRRRTFWIALGVAMIVVVAAVGGGIGGALASKSSRGGSNASAPQSEPASTPTSSASSTQPSASSPITSAPTSTPTVASSAPNVTTTEVVGASKTLLRDCPSSNGTLYDVTHGDTKMSYRKECETSVVAIKGSAAFGGTVVESLNECIDLCAAFNINNKALITGGSDTICNTVCWRNTFEKINDMPGGMCFGFTSENSTGSVRYTRPTETRCDSAVLINQPF